MFALLVTAFIMGGVGSLHCVGMCGPLALSLPVIGDSYLAKFSSSLLYNLGRMITYATMGAIFGLIGLSFSLMGFQQGLSLALGIIIITVVLLPKHSWISNSHQITQKTFSKLRESLAVLFRRRNYQSVFFIGLLNGLLPCGLVYMALAGAVSTASVINSSLFMAAFGLGTLPLMWSISFFGSFINLRTRITIRKAYPYLMVGIACLLIIRGIGIDIPFINTTIHHPAQNTGISGDIECFIEK
jgi:sulfite exporter TauE/SafE